MNWPSLFTSAAFEQWLVSTAGGARIAQGQRLDPLATSMRKFSFASEWLEAVERGESLPARGGSGVQAATDLRAAGLLAPGEPATLSDLGRECLEQWRLAGVANDDDSGELPRAVIAVIAGVRLGVPAYLEMLRFWKQLRSRYDVEALLSSPEWLFLASYLNQDAGGYNPWRALSANEATGPGAFDTDWASLLAGLTRVDATGAATNLRRRIDDYASRAFGRVVFCMAMELYVLSESGDLDEAVRFLSTWRLPSG